MSPNGLFCRGFGIFVPILRLKLVRFKLPALPGTVFKILL